MSEKTVFEIDEAPISHDLSDTRPVRVHIDNVVSDNVNQACRTQAAWHCMRHGDPTMW